ncbi:N-acetylmuramoyl-L-alanine amidase [Candidatus Fermentibacteria bacterium]|nr:N-acetylmuramoyl-L-alanine amidase [Candidatus Fermentibacteria bacterium]
MRRRIFLKTLPASAILLSRTAFADDDLLPLIGRVDAFVLEDQTRVVLELDGACPLDVRPGPPPQVVLKNALYLPVEDSRQLSSGPVRSYRIFTPSDEGYKTILEFDASTGSHVTARMVGDPPRVIVDVLGPALAPRIAATSPEMARLEAEAREEAERLRQRSSDGRLGLRIRNIVIDPGHGGHDPGAVGLKGTKEKDITLALSRLLAARLDRAGFGRIALTRTDDYYLNLSDRTAVANQYGADLFVSIHCNANENRKAVGSETFFCSEQASSAEAARVATFENSFAEPEELARQESLVDIEWVLFRLQRKLLWKDSGRIAADVQEALKTGFPVRSRGISSAGFFVLKKARMPSVLVETAFISNPDEELLLAREQAQERLVETLAAKLAAYAS